VRASLSVAWKNARAKVPYTDGESLVKPAAVKISRTMCNDAVAPECATEQHCQARLVNGPQLYVSGSVG